VTKLVITRGLPASGKSTWARAWVSEDPLHRAEVNRDHLRLMMHGLEWSGNTYLEDQVTAAQHSAISALLAAGIDVISSDTNLRQRYVRDLAKIARRHGAAVKVIDMAQVPLETCIERDTARGARGERAVGTHAIQGMHRRYIVPLHGGKFPLPAEDETTGDSAFVERIPGLPSVVVVDIDGTVALKGTRKPFDYTRVSEDQPNHDVIEQVRCAYVGGHEIIFLSGREGTRQCYDDTLDWLERHIPASFKGPFMRAEGDFRKDSIVKRELFDYYVRGKYSVAYVLDDRDQVVKMWRKELGLTCLQVAEGNF
jgi:predicted kinase